MGPAGPRFSQKLLFGVWPKILELLTGMKVLAIGFSEFKTPQSTERWDLALTAGE